MKSFFPFIIIAVCVATYYMYISPTYTSASVLAIKKSEYNQALKKSKELIEKRDALLVAYNQIPPEDIDRLQRIIPNSINSVDIVTQVNALASPRNLEVRNVSVTGDKPESQNGAIIDPVTNAPYKTTNVTVTLIGQYEQFTGFVRDLESSTRLSDITAVTVKPNTKVSEGESFEFTLNFKTYSL